MIFVRRNMRTGSGRSNRRRVARFRRGLVLSVILAGALAACGSLWVPNTRPVLVEECWRRVWSRVVGEWARRRLG